MADSENKVLSALTVKLTNDENGNSSSAVRLTPGHLLYTNTDSVTGVDIGEVGKLKGSWSAVQGTLKVTEAIEDDDAVPLYQAEAITKHMIDHMVLQDIESTENKLVSDHPIHLQSDQSVLTLDTNGVYLGTADGKGLKIYEENGVGNVQLTAGTNLVKEVDGKIVDYATVADIEASKYALLQRNNVWTSANTFEDGLYVKYSEFDRPIKDEEAINLGYLNKVVAERFDKWTGPVSEISEKLDSEIEARKEADKELAANVTEQMSGIKAAVTKLSEDNVRQDIAVSEVSESLGNLEGTVSDITGILTQHAHEITVLQEKDADLSEAIIKEGKIRSENDIKLRDELGVEIQNRSENDVKISEFANKISEFANKISETLAEDYYDKSLLYTKSEADYLHQSEYLARVKTEAHLSEQIVKSSTLGCVFQNSATEESWDGSVRLLQGGSYSDAKVSFQSYSVDRIGFSILDTDSGRLASMSVSNDGVDILGNADIVGKLAVSAETKTNTLVVNTDASVGRDVTVHRHLVVEGNTNLHNSLNVGEDANVAGSVLTNAVNTKIANVSDRLLVGGTTKFIGDVLANSDIRVDGSFNAMAGAEMYPNLSGTALKTNGGTAHFDSVISFKGTEIELHGSLASEIESITNRVDALESPHFVIVEEIPNPEEAEFNVIYLVPHPHEGAEDNHDEYIKVLKDGVYVIEKIGHTDINLSNYYTKDDVYNKGEVNAKFTEELSNYVDKDMLATKTTELSEKIVDGYYDKPQVDALVGARVAKITGGPGIIVETEALNHANYEISMHLGRTVRPVESGDASPLASDKNDLDVHGNGALVIPRTDLRGDSRHYSRDELKNGDFYQNTGRFWGSVKVVSNMDELLRCYNSSALDNYTSPLQTPRVYSFVPNVICIKDMLDNLTGGGSGSGSQLIGDATTASKGIVQLASSINDGETYRVVNAALLKDSISDFVSYLAGDSTSTTGSKHGNVIIASTNAGVGGFYCGYTNSTSPSSTNHITKFTYDRLTFIGSNSSNVEEYVFGEVGGGNAGVNQIARIKDINPVSELLHNSSEKLVELSEFSYTNYEKIVSVSEKVEELSEFSYTNYEKIVSVSEKVAELSESGGGGGDLSAYLKKTETIIGTWPGEPLADYNILIGNSTDQVAVIDSIVIGRNIRVSGHGTEDVIIGCGASFFDTSGCSTGTVVVGAGASATGGGTAIGFNAYASENYTVAIGSGARATHTGAVQLGQGTNDLSNSLQFRNYPLVLADGKIPNERLNFNPSTYITVSGATAIIKEEVKGEIESAGLSPVYNSLVKITDVTGVAEIGSFTTNAELEQTVSLPFIYAAGGGGYDGCFSDLCADRLLVGHISEMGNNNVLTVKSKSLSMQVSEISTGTPNAVIHITEVINDDNELHGLMNIAASVITVSSRSSEFIITNSANNYGISLNATGVEGEINLNAVGGVFVNGVEIGKEVVSASPSAYPFTASIEWEETASTISEGYTLHKPILVVKGGRFAQKVRNEVQVRDGKNAPTFSEFLVSDYVMIDHEETIYEMESFRHDLGYTATELYGGMLFDRVVKDMSRPPTFVVSGHFIHYNHARQMFKVVITTEKLVTEINGVEKIEIDCKLSYLENYCPPLSCTVMSLSDHTFYAMNENNGSGIAYKYIVSESKYDIPDGAFVHELSPLAYNTEWGWIVVTETM